MTTIIYALIGIIVLAIIVYSIIAFLRGKATIQDLVKSPIDLSKETQILSSDQVKDILLTQGGSSICGFFNIRLGDRTERLGQGNYITLFGIKGSFEFQVTSANARLIIFTEGTTKESEVIELPKVPMQKWIFISILRDGRRFDIMYDDRIVMSQRLAYFPSVVSNPLIVGSTHLIGSSVHILVAPYRMIPTQALQQRDSLADTNGKPASASAKGTGFGLPPMPFSELGSVCLPGLPCNPITKPPKNHLKAWSTPYY